MQWQTGTIKQLISQPHECSCGRIHSTSIQEVYIGNQVVDKLLDDIKTCGYKAPFIVSDDITEGLFGGALKKMLREVKSSFSEHVLYRNSPLVPDEKTVGELLIHFPKETDLIIGVGSGTINDLCRFMSYQMGVPYWIMGTAPSMDGYASTASPLIVNHVKITYYCHEPQRIYGDLKLLSQAPMIMISAGVGDLLGKYTALTDWKLGRIITGEYYCEYIVELVERAVEKCIQSVELVALREEEAIKALMEALILSGIAMSYTGNSRPASGSEHHLSHFWEMKNLLKGIENPLHGTKVGVGTLTIIQLYNKLLECTPDFLRAHEKIMKLDEQIKQNEILNAFEEAGTAILKEYKVVTIEEKQQRLELIKVQWDNIVDVIQHQQKHFEVCRPALEKLGAPTTPEEIKISEASVDLAIKYAKEIRPRYTVLQLIDDLDLNSFL